MRISLEMYRIEEFSRTAIRIGEGIAFNGRGLSFHVTTADDFAAFHKAVTHELLRAEWI